MNNTEWLNHMASNKATFHIYANLYSNPPRSWSCKLEIEEDGSTLTVKVNYCSNFDDAVTQCRQKYDRVTSGTVKFAGPLLEYVEAEAQAYEVGDEDKPKATDSDWMHGRPA